MVREQLAVLKEFKSLGLDGLYPRVLKKLAEMISEPPNEIFQRFWNIGELSENCQRVYVVPIFKKVKMIDTGNNRPITLFYVPISVKILEKVIKQHVCEHLKMNKVIIRNHHGLIKIRSCQINLAFFDKMTKLVDQGNVDRTYLDFSKWYLL